MPGEAKVLCLGTHFCSVSTVPHSYLSPSAMGRTVQAGGGEW